MRLLLLLCGFLIKEWGFFPSWQMGDINAILFAVAALDGDAQLLLFKSLKNTLVARGLLPLDA